MTILSIVTIVFNDKDGLQRTIASVDKIVAVYPNILSKIEHVIIDGKSTDGTVRYLLTLKKVRSVYTTFISEKDDGIYDAMNKGFKKARGQGVLFLNAGDEIYDKCNFDRVLMEFMESMKEPKEAGIVYSAIMRIGNFAIKIRARNVFQRKPRMPGIHQAMIYKRSQLISIPFKTNFNICGDYDNFCSIINQGNFFRPIDDIFTIFYAGGVSSKSPVLLFRESYKISKTQFKLSFFNKTRLLINLFLSLASVQILMIFEKYLHIGKKIESCFT